MQTSARILNVVDQFDDATVRRVGSRVLADFGAKRAAERAAAVAAASRAKQQQAARAYAGAQVGRLNSDWSALQTSADSEILTSLRLLRARSRELVRDNEYAKQAVRVIKNNVIGTGVGMQAQVMNARGKLVAGVNDNIEDEWCEWIDGENCHTGGLLSLPDIERLIFDELVAAGEVLVRYVDQPFGNSRIPLALEVIEADRLMDNWQAARAPNGNAIRMGVEVDQWGRPTAYWLYPHHPGDYQFTTFTPSKFIRIPATEIEHLYLIDRWPQTRGEPWMHATLKRLHNMGGYEEAEIVAARASANIVGFIRTPEGVVPDDVEAGRQLIDTEPGTWQTLLPGEQVDGFNPSRPNAALEPFMRFMLRGFAAGVGISYESASRDYSQSNYSSSRLALLDDRDLWRVLQGWYIRRFRSRLHRRWLDGAVLVGAVKAADYYTATRKYQKVRFKPRGWSWIDPTREVSAYKLAVRCGFMSPDDVIAQTANGADIEDVYNAIRRSRDLADELKLVFDTDAEKVNDKGQVQASAPPSDGSEPADPDVAQESSETATDPEAGEPGEKE
ncbi:MAG: phage portal protein [Proteobacteria bacterium]|nr:phage portal protein [Pseudomonadota bacterium]